MQMLSLSGHRAETLTSLIQCSNFCKNHNTRHEALYQFFVSIYIAHHSGSNPHRRKYIPNQSENMETILKNLVHQFTSVSSKPMTLGIRNTFLKQKAVSFEDFYKFMTILSNKQDTIKFCRQFVMVDCFVYLGI